MKHATGSNLGRCIFPVMMMMVMSVVMIWGKEPQLRAHRDLLPAQSLMLRITALDKHGFPIYPSGVEASFRGGICMCSVHVSEGS